MSKRLSGSIRHLGQGGLGESVGSNLDPNLVHGSRLWLH